MANSTKLDRKQDFNALYQVCVFRADQKNKRVALASDWLRHFRLLLWNCWTEFNETWQEARSQRPLPYQVCVFRADRKNKMAALASDWLRHFRLLFWNCWTKFNKTWQEARSHCPLPSLCFWADRKNKMAALASDCWDIFDFSSETAEWNSTKLDRKQDLNALYQVCVFQADRKNKMAALASDWLRHFLTSPLKPQNGIQRNLRGSKISTSASKFVIFGPIGKTRLPPQPLIGWDIFYFFSETAEQNSTKLDRKQDLNVLYQVCVFQVDGINKMATPPMICWDIFNFSSETAE